MAPQPDQDDTFHENGASQEALVGHRRSWEAERAAAQNNYTHAIFMMPHEEHEAYETDSHTLTFDSLSYDGTEIVPETVSARLIENIARRDDYYAHLLAIDATRVTESFRIGYLLGGDTAGTNQAVTIANVARGLTDMAKAGIFANEVEAQQRVAEISRLTSIETMRTEYASQIYRNMIDGQHYEIPTASLVNILLSDDEDYQRFLAEDGDSEIPTEHLAYALKQFVSGNRLFARFVIPDNIRDRYVSLLGYEQVDFESVNQLTTLGDMEIVGEAVVDESLRRKVMEDIPEDLNDLERAFWMYLKLCQTLTYDAECYAYDSEGPVTLKYQDVARISAITPESNSAVCVEFNVIFQKLLQEAGIGFSTQYGSLNEPNGFFLNAGFYGEGHAYCRCRAGAYIVDFDSVRKVIGGDLAGAKLQQPLNGVICRNKNQGTRQEFGRTLARITKRFYESQPPDQISDTVQVAVTPDILAEHLTGVDERVADWIRAIDGSGLAPVDGITRLLVLRREILGNEENGSVSLSIVRENANDSTPIARPVVLITVETTGHSEHEAGRRYFSFSPPGHVMPQDHADIEQRFADHHYEYLFGQEAHPVPGLQVPAPVQRT